MLTHARTKGELQRLPGVFLGVAHRLLHVDAIGDGRGQRGSQCAARPMVTAGQARPGIAAHHAVTVVQGIDDFTGVFVSTGDQHVFAARSEDALRAFREIGVVVAVFSIIRGEATSFNAVWRDDGGLRNQQFADCRQHVFGCEFIAAPRGQHRVENQRDFGVIGNHFGDRSNGFETAEHADLECGDRHVFENAARLVGDPFTVDRQHAVDAHGVLHRDCGDHGNRVATHAGKRHDVGLQSGAAGRIGGGEHHDNGRGISHARGSHARGWARRWDGLK